MQTTTVDVEDRGQIYKDQQLIAVPQSYPLMRAQGTTRGAPVLAMEFPQFWQKPISKGDQERAGGIQNPSGF